MVAPVTNNGGIGALQRSQQTQPANQISNRQVAQAVLNKTPNAGRAASSKSVSLASASPPPSNLPRGSIVDRLV